jgi:hypothetical protein
VSAANDDRIDVYAYLPKGLREPFKHPVLHLTRKCSQGGSGIRPYSSFHVVVSCGRSRNVWQKLLRSCSLNVAQLRGIISARTSESKDDKAFRISRPHASKQRVIREVTICEHFEFME